MAAAAASHFDIYLHARVPSSSSHAVIPSGCIQILRNNRF